MRRRGPKSEERIVSILSGRGLTLAAAESCTGGLVGYRITSVSGSSACFSGAVVAYDNSVKRKVLGVAGE
jgi:PncC family amidohydrolase